jgi:hypothetical protein
MGRVYPLRLEVVGDFEGFTPQVWSKGHHDPCRFLRRAAVAVRRDIDDDEACALLKLGHDRVKHQWWRTDLRGCHETGDVVYQEAAGPGPGVFPATVVWMG